MEAQKPVIGILMGSDSDLKVMAEAAKVLEDFGVSYAMTICSAHRTPEATAEYAKTAATRGLKVLIAGAGGAAHLPGVIAAYTVLPVIGVPIKSAALNGVDSLYSIVQMPSGIPVATVGINGAKNAALLALAILGSADPQIYEQLTAYRSRLAQEVEGKAERLAEVGYMNY